jgi:hypothetical protein
VALLTEQHADLPQCDELCGPFWVATVLRATGFSATQEQAALAAGSVLAPPDAPSSLPPGETGRRAAVALPVAAPGEPAGTSAHGVARAVEELSGGRLAAVPATGAWTAERLIELLAGVTDPVIANLFTGALWDPSVSDEQVRRYAETGVDEGPDNAWRVGHFLLIADVQQGRLLRLADSYESRAMHMQPVERVVAALQGRGLLVVTEDAAAVRALVDSAGLERVLWDNGSPQPR